MITGLTFAGCSPFDDDLDEGVETSFEVRVSGEFERIVQGSRAVYGRMVEAEEVEDVFIIQLTSESQTERSSFFFGGRLDEGFSTGEVYPVAEVQAFDEGEILFDQLKADTLASQYVITDASEETGTFLARHGQVEIEDINEEGMTGQFSFYADGHAPENPDSLIQVVAEGEFEAAKAEFREN